MAESKLNTQQDTYRGVYPSVFKRIDQDDVFVNTFQAHKSWSITSGSDTPIFFGVYTDPTRLPALGTTLTYNDAANPDGSLQSVTYYSVNHLFYKWKTEPLKTYGPTNLNRTSKHLFESASVISIPQKRIGEGIKPSSFKWEGSGIKLASDRYSNLINTEFDTTTLVSGTVWYEGFNEWFDASRQPIGVSGITVVPGITTTTGAQRPLGYAAAFTGSSFIQTEVPGEFNRDNDYAVSFFISASSAGTETQLITAKATSSAALVYPWRVELSGSKQIIFTVGATSTIKAQLTSSVSMTGSWHHVVCQKTASSVELWIDNVLHATQSYGFLQNQMSFYSASGRIDNTSPVMIGGFSPVSSNLNAYLDEIRVFNTGLDSSNVTSLFDRSEGGSALQTNRVGNVFSKQGLVVISSADYRYADLLKSPFTASYKSTKTISELNTVVKLSTGDYNMTLNPTVTLDDDSTYAPFVSGSDFQPYITTVGLYDDAGRLVAVGKLAQPVQKRSDVDMNILVKIDLDQNPIQKVSQ